MTARAAWPLMTPMPRPARTVTMVFTDIENSTLLVRQSGEHWPQILDEHRQICRAAWTYWGGQEVDTAGDGFFVVFDSTINAVRAAIDAQVNLLGFSWPVEESVRVRMGLHTGSATEYDGSWIGYEVHRAARIAGAAHGGQVLISRTVEWTPERDQGLDVDNLGEHQLKDLAELETLFQVIAPGLPREFPAPRSVSSGTEPAAMDFPATMRNPVDIPPAALTGVDGTILAVTGYGLRIGRTPDNDLIVADHEVSRHHCAITATDGGFVLTDLRSTNGTRINGVGVTSPRLLADGDALSIGGAEFVFTWPA